MASLNDAYNGFIFSQKEIDASKENLKNIIKYRDLRNYKNAQSVTGSRKNNYFTNDPIIPIKKPPMNCQRCNGERIEIFIDKQTPRFKCKFCGYISID